MSRTKNEYRWMRWMYWKVADSQLYLFQEAD
jgi:hypothetical protein